MPGDPHWDSVKLLMGFEGLDGSVSFVDERGLQTFTPSGNVHIETSQFKFGQSSAEFDGSGDFITVSNEADFSIANSLPMTIETFVNIPVSKTAHTICAKRPSSSAHEFDWRISSVTPVFLAYRNGSNIVTVTAATSLILDTWYHLAMTRLSGVWRLFVNGVLDAQATEANTPSNSSQGLVLGRQVFDSSRDLQGFLDEFRFTRGVARYTSDFTPPTVPFDRGPVVPSFGIGKRFHGVH